MSFLKVLVVILEALPLLLKAIDRRYRKKRDAEIEKDPLAEFESKFGKLRDDTHPEPNQGMPTTKPSSHKDDTPS